MMRPNLRAPLTSPNSPKRTPWTASTRNSPNLRACKILAMRVSDPSRVALVCYRPKTSRMSHQEARSRQIHKSANKYLTPTQTISTKQLKASPQAFLTIRKTTTSSRTKLGKVTRRANQIQLGLVLKIITTMTCSEQGLLIRWRKSTTIILEKNLKIIIIKIFSCS